MAEDLDALRADARTQDWLACSVRVSLVADDNDADMSDAGLYFIASCGYGAGSPVLMEMCVIVSSCISSEGLLISIYLHLCPHLHLYPYLYLSHSLRYTLNN